MDNEKYWQRILLSGAVKQIMKRKRIYSVIESFCSRLHLPGPTGNLFDTKKKRA
jgi:hypothetical protein